MKYKIAFFITRKIIEAVNTINAVFLCAKEAAEVYDFEWYQQIVVVCAQGF